MQPTNLLYLDDTYCVANLCKVLDGGQDAQGQFLVFDQTIYYPGGGGQPKDRGHMECAGAQWKITSADFNGGVIKHYVDGDIDNISTGDSLAMSVCRQSRLLYSIYHTAGHWIASAVTDNLQLPWVPLKGYHYPDGAYVEFDGDTSAINEGILEDLRFVLMIDAQAPLCVTSEIIAFDDLERLKKANVPENFKPNPDKPLRLVKMENYRSVPCGGTHIRSIREIKALSASKITVKNGKIRVSYHCTPWEMPVS